MNSNSSQRGSARRLPVLFMVMFSLILAGGLFWMSKATTATANFPDISLAENTYPAIVGSRIDSCSLCHTSAPNLNPYGSAYKAKGRGFAASLTGIESVDSDGDGFSNIVEISALTFPGDAADHPASTGPTATTVPTTAYPPPATSTSVPSTATKAPPTATKLPATATSQGPTATKAPATATSQGPTATKTPATATPQGPTATGLAATATKPVTSTKAATATRRPVTLTKTPGPRPTPVVQCVKDDDKTRQDLSTMSQKDREDHQRVNPCPPGYHPREREWEHKQDGSGDDFFTKALKKIESIFQGNKNP